MGGRIVLNGEICGVRTCSSSRCDDKSVGGMLRHRRGRPEWNTQLPPSAYCFRQLWTKQKGSAGQRQRDTRCHCNNRRPRRMCRLIFLSSDAASWSIRVVNAKLRFSRGAWPVDTHNDRSQSYPSGPKSSVSPSCVQSSCHRLRVTC
jgi:hypothetical protein